MTSRKQRAHKRGHAAEKIAALYLFLKGYKILATRYKTPVGEIDLVARRGRTIVMVEVKTRSQKTDALESITVKNQYRVGRASEFFLLSHPQCAEMNIRFDVIVMGWPFFWQHLDNAWQTHS